jgi:hypothetical protein
MHDEFYFAIPKAIFYRDGTDIIEPEKSGNTINVLTMAFPSRAISAITRESRAVV